MPTDGSDDAVERRRVDDMRLHLVVPQTFVPRDPVFETLAEPARVETLSLRFAFEQPANGLEGQTDVVGQSIEVVQVPALHPLDNAP